MPAFLGPTLQEHLHEFGRYPPIKGIAPLRDAIVAWLGQRYPILKGQIDAESHVLPLNGSREGLFSAIFPAMARRPALERPAVLIPNPFYQAYGAAAAAAGAEPVLLPSTAETDFLPRLAAIDESLLERAVAFYLCTPANPQGAVADRAYLAQLIALARRHDFLLFADECYSEIYSDTPPPGALVRVKPASWAPWSGEPDQAVSACVLGLGPQVGGLVRTPFSPSRAILTEVNGT